MIRLAIALPALAMAASVAAAPTLGPAYGEDMVLQRGQPIELEGKAQPGETVVADFSGNTASAQANADGSFRITLAALPADTESSTLVLRDKTGETRYEGIAIGDVILCSGQSNMELPINRALDTYNQLRLAPDDSIRLLTIPKTTATVPLHKFAEPVKWVAADSETVAEFSAACFYMGKRLRALRPAVPVGLIHSSWGGSAARAWLTPKGVSELYGGETLELLRTYSSDPYAATRRFIPQWMEWWREQDNGREPWREPDTLEWAPIPQFSFWNDWTGTGLDTNPRANVWLRQTFTLTREQANRDGRLSIGAIDDLDLTFVNGEPVGYTFGWGIERTYTVPDEFLREGENEILIAANNMWDMGGFFAGPDRLFFTPGNGDEPIPLGADWEYAKSGVEGVPPRAPWDANAGAGVMHNAMIAPLGPIRLAAVAWYQGEADVGQPDYDEKLRVLFEGWRDQFGSQARMLVVQLADFGQRQSEPVESGWAVLRQEQLAGVMADGNASLVTAIDIGEPADIHPANKNVLGVRLADAFTGRAMPMPQSAVRDDAHVTVSFTGIEGGLVAHGGPVPLGVEICGTAVGSCRYVLARLVDDTMVIDLGDGDDASRVRHAWSDAPVVNLYDGAGHPVPGFELSIE
jgi:sialate O-acetylesterase